MYPASFQYHRPGSVEEAVSLLSELGDDAKLLAGGHSLLPVMKLRFAEPGHLVDMGGIDGLAGIREDGDHVVIGAMTTHRQVEHSELLAQRLPILPETAAVIGDPLVRNRGTVGGSLAHADPAADLPGVMLAVDASVTAVGPDGSRTITSDDFFMGMFTTALSAGEVLTEVRIPLPGPNTGGAYEKFAHPASGYAMAGAAVVLSLSGDGSVASARIAVTGVGGGAARATAAEEALVGGPADGDALDAAAAKASDGLTAQDDLQGSAEYKLNLVRVMARRAMARALERAGG